MKTVGCTQCCSNLERWLRASNMWLDSSLKEGKNKTGLNLETYGSVGKRWDDSETQREKGDVWKLRTRKEKTEMLRRERDEDGENLWRWQWCCIQRIEEEASWITGLTWSDSSDRQTVSLWHLPPIPPANSPSASSSTQPDPTQADWALGWPWRDAETLPNSSVGKAVRFWDTKNPSGEPALTLWVIVDQQWFIQYVH